MIALSNVDIVTITVVVLGLLYWFFWRKKPKDDETYKKLVISPAFQRSDSYDPSFINRMKHSGKNVVVFYGSQTGTAEEFAGRLAKDANRYRMKGLAADLEDCDMDEIPKLATVENSLAIFCMATYGEGDPTDNAQEFIQALKNESVSFNGVRYAVFGLGNKTYEHYNEIGIYVDQRLEELGGERVYQIGLGDDDANIEEDFVTWCENFWPVVCDTFGIETTGDDMRIRQYNLTVHQPGEISPEKLFTGEPVRLKSFQNQRPPYDAKNPLMARFVVKRELHKGGDRSCMHCEFDIEGSRLRYESGDHLALYPRNDLATVEALGKRLGADLDEVITMTNVDDEASKKHPFPCPTTWRTALLYYVDISHPPRTHVLKEILDYATGEDQEFLKKLTASSPEGKSLYNEWIVKDRRDISAVLEDLHSLCPPIDHLCELLPRLQARYYSISSSPKVDATRVSITAVLVKYETRAGRIKWGIATRYLASLSLDTTGDTPIRVPIYVRKSSFKLPFRSMTPVCMIGPGTGFSPFRGFIQERDYFRRLGKPMGATILFFGCRRSDEDYLYEDEIQKYKTDGTLTSLYVAFSREQTQKVYVQHLIHQNKDELWQLIENGGHIYVCGDARQMAPDVLKVLQDLIREKNNFTQEQAVDYMKKMHTRGRYSADVWS